MKKFKMFYMLIIAFVCLSSSAFALPTAKVNDFKIIHQTSTIQAHSSYAKLNKLSDSALKATVTSPEGGDYVTVKTGTMDLRDGNTRVYLLKQRGFGDLSIPYDNVDTSYHYDF